MMKTLLKLINSLPELKNSKIEIFESLVLECIEMAKEEFENERKITSLKKEFISLIKKSWIKTYAFCLLKEIAGFALRGVNSNEGTYLIQEARVEQKKLTSLIH